ncbi:MAG: peptide-binding protein [Paracoccus sp. (in: a-proteobacteria)]
MKRFSLIALLAAGPVTASPEYVLPTLFDVSGVAAWDQLNIRSGPNASAEIIGSLAPDAVGVEVMALDSSGCWGLVNAGERAGWAAMRHLNYRTDVWLPGELPAGLSCGGTEPFWSIHADGGSLIWSEPGHEIALSGLTVLDSGFRDPHRGLHVEDDHDLLSAVISPAQCSDGMSDMAYGLEITVLRQSGNRPVQMYRGCCRIVAPR